MKRSDKLDFFRGILLILMTIDHILPSRDITKYFTCEFIGWVTAAEGFVFLSGLTAGLVYTRRMIEKGENFVSVAAKARAWLIYKNHIAILFFALLAVLFGYGVNEYWGNNYGLFYNNPFLSMILGTVLLYQPAYLDILPMYTIFVLFVPIIIKYFIKGYAWYIFVLSTVVYIISFFIELDYFKEIPGTTDMNFGFFNILSWQFVFFIGLFSGFSLYHGRSAWWVKNKPLLSLSITVCLVLFILKITRINVDELGFLFSRSTLGLVRIINCMAVIFIISFISSVKKNWFSFKPACYLGQHSLEVFSFHVVLLIIFKPFIQSVSGVFSFQISRHFFIYPVSSLIIFCFILPALFLAPTFFKKKTYVLSKNEINPSPSEDWLTNAKVLTEDYKQAV
ncbi:OpgC family protein [Hymenobacter sp. HD11105]